MNSYNNKILNECENNMLKRIKSYENDLMRIRTGRASINLLDKIKIEYYGTLSPLNQVATLSTPDSKTLCIAPFEPKLASEIEKAILKSDLGLQPINDGKIIRINIPPLTEERRKNIVKNIKKMAEEAKITLRNIRRDFNDQIKKYEKNKEISEDESKRLQVEVQKITDKYTKIIDDKTTSKEKEVITI